MKKVSLDEAFSDLGKLALSALIEGRVDISIDQYTPPKLKAFLVAAHRNASFHAECMEKEKK